MTRLYGPPAKQYPVFPDRHCAGYYARVLIVDGLTVGADEAVPVVSGRDALLDRVAAGAAIVHNISHILTCNVSMCVRKSWNIVSGIPASEYIPGFFGGVLR